MRYLYFKPNGALHVKTSTLEPELDAAYPNPIAVHDDYETLKQDGVAEEAGMPAPMREKTRSEIEADVTYSERRAAAYPILADQLDKIFHDIENGTLTQSGDFFTAIKAVKDQYPKP